MVLPAAPILFELDVDALLERPLPAYVPVPRQQSVWRDIAVIAPDAVSHDALMACIAAGEGDGDAIVRGARLFDVYRPAAPVRDMADGERSLAVRLELLDDKTPLTDERVDAIVGKLIATLQQRLGVRLRG